MPPDGTELELRWQLSRHARRLLTLALGGLVAATLSRRPEFAGLAAPALLLLAAGRGVRPAAAAVSARASTRRAFEGEVVAVDVELTGTGQEHAVKWSLQPGHSVLPAGPGSADGPRARLLVSPEHWGHRRLGTLEVVLRDRWRLTEGHGRITLPALDCYPHPAQLDTRVVLSRLPNRLGEHTARVSGDGAEFAGIREYVPGDRQRGINWAASTRRGRLQVNTFAAERSQDVVLLCDASTDVGEPGSSALDLALRGAAAAARTYLDARDRVGVVAASWGGTTWLAPGMGRRQVYRIIDTMLSAESGWSGGSIGLRRLPRAALPPGALVIAFSPLLDTRFVETLRDMRQRGFTMLVVDVLNVTPPVKRGSTHRTARRIWQMEQEAIRFSLRELGIPVTHWDGVQLLDLPLAPYTRRPLYTHRSFG